MDTVENRKFETQQQFADRCGKHKSYVTRLKHAGRLVMVGGFVDVERSLALIAETSDPEKIYVAERLAAERAAKQDGRPVKTIEDTSEGGGTYQEARAIKARYDALAARRDYEIAIGKLIDRQEVDQALLDVVSFARKGLENLPHRVAAQLVGKDFDQIMAILRTGIIGIMDDMHREAQKQFREGGQL